MTILLIIAGVAVLAFALVALVAMLPDEWAIVCVAVIVGLPVLYGLVRFVKWAWGG